MSILEALRHPTKKTRAPQESLPKSLQAPSSWQTLIYFLPPEVCLSRTFHTSEIIQRVVFCDWLLSHSILLLRSAALLSGVKDSNNLHLGRRVFW